MGKNKNILLCPLDWGLGHTTRCIPIIQKLIESNCNVIVAGNEISRKVILHEIPQIKFVYLKGYNISYSRSLPFIWKLIIQLPKIILRIIIEHYQLKKIIKQYKIDIVISDNRFGLWSNKVKSIYITHQIVIKCPEHMKFFEKLLYKTHKWFINKYNECWIPDFEEEPSLSGELSHKYPKSKKMFFIGPLSRVQLRNNDHNKEYLYDVLFIISGPEPQRTEFEKIILKSIAPANLKIAVIRGIANEIAESVSSKNMVINYADRDKLQFFIDNSELIISRSGYSTIMDVAISGKKAFFIPTPGQTEQEYLAAYHKEKGTYNSLNQNKFSLEKVLSESLNFTAIKLENDYNILAERICLL